ncbi:type II secretion system protein [Neptuniibacter sp. QD34_54]|uniref:type II secretion system protein n=1 Tax=Neptuniibacter sp. QD34_54 TaxID=3398208 RepID=UPI0039F5CD03
MSNQHNFPNKRKQQGFTLIELLVVVSVLAAMAGIAAVAMDGYEQDAQEQLVQTEMKRIASAIYRFKEDTGYFPKEGLFSADSLYGVSTSSTAKNQYENSLINFNWLFESPIQLDTDFDGDIDSNDVSGGVERLAWNINSSRGWNGPYLDLSSQSSVVANSTICGLSESNFDTGFDGNDAVGLTDTFERNTSGSESCAAVKYSGEWVRREFTGQAYRYFTAYKNDAVIDCLQSGNGCIAVVSAGADSVLDTDLTDAVTNDIVHILRVNP